MKIGQPSDLPVLPAGSQPPAAPAQSGGAAAASPQQAAGVAVSVSAQVRSLAQADGADEVDMDKVNAVRNAIADGSYQVNAEAIADKLLANAQEMLDRTRR